MNKLFEFNFKMFLNPFKILTLNIFSISPSKAGNMDRARWTGSNWPDILEGQAVKLAARIKSGPIGPARIGPQPIWVRVGPARFAQFFI